MTAPWPDPRFSELSPELLASLFAGGLADAVVQHVQLRIEPGVDEERPRKGAAWNARDLHRAVR